MNKVYTLFFLLCFIFHHAQNTSKADLVEQARNYFDNEEYTKAAAAYEKVLKVDPKNTEMLNLTGMSYFNIKDFNKAREKFRLAALYTPANEKSTLATYYSNLSASYLYLDDREKAYQYAIKAYQADDSQDLTLWNAASNSQNFGKCDEAIAIMDKTKLEKHYSYNTLYARCYYRKQDFAKSAQYYKKFFDAFSPDDNPNNIVVSDERSNYFNALMEVTTDEIRDHKKNLTYKDDLIKFAADVADSKDRSIPINYFFKDNTLYPEIRNDEKFIALQKGVMAQLKLTSQSEKMLESYNNQDYNKTIYYCTKQMDANSSETSFNEARSYLYKASAHLLFQDIVKSNKLDQDKLNNLLKILQSYYPKGKMFSDQEMHEQKLLSESFMDTWIIAKDYVKDGTPDAKILDVLRAVVNNFPNMTMRNTLNEVLNKGKLDN